MYVKRAIKKSGKVWKTINVFYLWEIGVWKTINIFYSWEIGVCFLAIIFEVLFTKISAISKKKKDTMGKRRQYILSLPPLPPTTFYFKNVQAYWNVERMYNEYLSNLYLDPLVVNILAHLLPLSYTHTHTHIYTYSMYIFIYLFFNFFFGRAARLVGS